MRRQGYEFAVSRPKVILKKDETGGVLEPVEELTIDVPNEFVGAVMEKLGPRKGEDRRDFRDARVRRAGKQLFRWLGRRRRTQELAHKDGERGQGTRHSRGEYARAGRVQNRARGTGRPTKKDRRAMEAFVDPAMFGFEDLDDDFDDIDDDFDDEE